MKKQDIVAINNHDLQVKEYQGQRVVTLKDIDQVHERPEGTADRNFRANESHFIEGTDYFRATRNQNNEIRGFEIPSRGVILLTQSGYLMLVKSFTDDLAWDVQRDLVNHYFVAEAVMNPSKLKGENSAMRERAMLINATNKAAVEIRNALKEAGVDPNYRVLALKGVYSEVGFEVPTEGLTVGEKSYDATTIAKMLGVLSTSGNPHGQAVSAIIQDVGTGDGETKRVPFMNNGHSDSCIQYTQAVVDRVANWLKEKGYPTPIVLKKKYNVVYKEVK